MRLPRRLTSFLPDLSFLRLSGGTFGFLLSFILVASPFSRSHAQDPMRMAPDIRLLDNIRTAYHRGDYRAALTYIQELESYGSLSAESAEEADFLRACAAARLQLPETESLLAAFIDEYPSSGRIHAARFELVEWYYRAKAYEKVTARFPAIDLSLLTDQQAHAGRFYWGYSLFGQKKLKEALPLFNAIKTSAGPYASAASYYAGFCAFSLGNLTEALGDLRRLENQDSYRDVVPVLIAHILSRQGQATELLAYARSMEQRKGVQNIADIRLLASEAYYAQGKYQEAWPGYADYLKGKNAAEASTAGIFYRAGHTAHQLGKYAEAAQWLKPIAGAKDSLGRHASYFLGVSFLRTGQKQSALTAFQTSASTGSDALAAESHFQSAKLLYDLMFADRAIEEMEAFLQRYPGHVHEQEMRELVSGAYVNANNYHKALRHIESLATRTPVTDRAYQKAALFYGFEFYNRGEWEQATLWFSKSLTYPLDQALAAEAAVWSGEALSQSGKPVEACTQYERVIGNPKAGLPVLLRARYGLGYARFNQRQYEKALVSFREYVKIADRKDARLAEVLARFGDCQYVQKSYQDALQTYRRAYESGPAAGDYARMQAGIVSGILRKYDEAIALLGQVVRDYPSSVYWDEALFQKAQLEFERGKYEDAREDYTWLMQEHPDSRFVPFALVRRAAAEFNLKAYSSTADDYIRAITEYPSHPACDDVMLPLQEALGLAGRADEFDGLLRRFKESNPKARGLESVEFETAKSLYFSQKYAEAIRSLTNYLAAYPGHVHADEARYYRAEALYRTKDFTAALQSYYELADKPQFANAHRVAARTGELEFRAGAFDRAIQAYSRLVQLAQAPKDRMNGWAGQMDGWYRLGKYDSALRYASLLLEDQSAGQVANNRANLVSGRCWQAMGENDKALDAYLSVVNDSKDELGAEAKFRVAEMQFSAKDFKGCYETVVSLNQEYGTYTEWTGRGFLLLAESFVATGEIFQATATLQSLDKFPLQHIRDEARRRLARIEAGADRTILKQDTTDHD